MLPRPAPKIARWRRRPETGLQTRQAFEAKLAAALVAEDHVAVALVHLDRFGRITDSLGLEAGDAILDEMGDRLQATFGDEAVVARWTGAQFALLWPAIEAHTAALRVADVRSVLEAPVASPELGHLRLRCSVGLASAPAHGRSTRTLLVRAAIAMRHARNLGGGRTAVYDPAWAAQARRALIIEHSLEPGLAAGEVKLHYQPIISLETGHVVALEALVRWDHPTLGRISPAAFVPIVEQTPAIEMLGAWGIEQACRDLASWQAAGLPPVRVHVNLSPRQLLMPGLERLVRDQLRRHDLDPGLLEIEITEAALASSVDEVRRTLDGLRALGVRISIDDFGTGYSALAHLTRFRVDTIKLDKGFVDQVADGNSEVAGAILALAHHLGYHVVAEGVESEDQVRWLQKNRCHEAQGFLFSRAVPADQLPALLRMGYSVPPDPSLYWDLAEGA